MTDGPQSRFYVAISAEADEDDLIADIVFGGEQIASAAKRDGEWVLTLYNRDGSGERHFPFADLMKALQEAADRLT